MFSTFQTRVSLIVPGGVSCFFVFVWTLSLLLEIICIVGEIELFIFLYVEKSL